jgi:predicted O-methyltransferase YrrM
MDKLMKLNNGIEIHQTTASVGANGELVLDGVPFSAGETVGVLVLPKILTQPSRAFPGSALELFLRTLTPASTYGWDKATIPDNVERFEDLAFLFELSPLNRGIVRMDFDEAAAIFKAVSAMKAPHGIEIGRFNGGSTLLLATAVGAGGHVTSVDRDPRDDNGLTSALSQAGLKDRVELITADANDVDIPGPFDFALIDGDHSYEAAKRDHNRWSQRVKPGGLIIHHDMANTRRFATQWTDLARLRCEILECQSGEMEILQEAGSVTIFRRTAASLATI